MNRARNEILARAALAGDEHGQVVALESLNLVGQPIHRRSSTDEPWEERFERSTVLVIDSLTWTLSCPAQIETLSRDGGEHAQSSRGDISERCRQLHDTAACAVLLIRAEWFHEEQPVTVL
jgi:hypothetical protein